MKSVVTDIDIDTPDRSVLLKLFKNTTASNHSGAKPRAHNTGVYFHKVPVDPLTNRCSVDYKEAEEMGFFKIDILNVGIYKEVRDDQHMNELLETEPLWELLDEEEFCNLVFHMRGHHDVCNRMKPTNTLQLAAVLAMIRPAKRYLVGSTWEQVMQEVWIKPDNDQYYFKKSHAVSYAMAVRLHMNLIIESLSK